MAASRLALDDSRPDNSLCQLAFFALFLVFFSSNVIRLYAWPTPDARKISVMLEETGLPYEIIRSDQPPAIEDDEVPLELAEPVAILIYLAERTGRLFPVERRYRYPALQWLLFQEKDGERFCAALDQRLHGAEFLAGAYSIADIAAYPWVMRHAEYGLSLERYPTLRRWADAIGGRPAVQRGMAVLQASA
jgi:GST-like protein